MEVLNVKGLSKNFGGIQVLQNVSFSVHTGEKLVIIGPNGAGKTTLLNLLNGQLSPTSGQIYLFGEEITSLPTHRRVHLGQGRSFQISSLCPNLTILDNMLLAIQGTQPCRFQIFRSITIYKYLYDKAQELLGAMGLWEKRDDPVQTLSSGEQRGLEVALGLASEQRLLLLDEPSSGLTAGECTNVVKIIRNRSRDAAVVIIDHDMDLVFNIAERIIVLYYGQIIAEGKPEEIQRNARVKEIYMGIQENSGNVKTY